MAESTDTDEASQDDAARRWIERSEPITLALAAFSVALYLLDLAGIIGGVTIKAMVGVIDVLFVVDLLLKLMVLRGPYAASPWFLIDLISCLPALSWAAALPASLQGLRFVRAFRLLRVLRALRALRLLRSLSALRLGNTAVRSLHTRRYERALTTAVLGYTAVFIALIVSFDDPNAELHLVLGSVLGMGLVLFVVRFQLADITHGHVRQLLNAALPRQVADHFLAHPETYDRTVYMPATVIFCDLRGFTRTVEALGGDMMTLKVHLERAMDAVVAAHVKHDLIVDKLIGDAVMSFRGGNLVDGAASEHAVRAVLAAFDSIAALKVLDDPYFHTIKVGGASAESAMIGTFGSSDRLSYTILGDRVNLAARLEAACGQLRASNLFDPETVRLVGDQDGLHWRRVGRLKVPGKNEIIEAWEALPGDPEPWLEGYAAALASFEAGRFDEAREGFEAVLRVRDTDGPSRVFWAECRHRAREPVPEEWDGALEMAK